MSKDDKVVRYYTYHRNGIALLTNSLNTALKRNDGDKPVTYIEIAYK
jgi:hypothetical protein